VKPPNRNPDVLFPEYYPIPEGYDIDVPFYVFDRDGDIISSELILLDVSPDWIFVDQDTVTPGL
jgi:hypothetical protein